MHPVPHILLSLLVIATAGGAALAEVAPATRPATQPALPMDTSKAWVLHVPGIAGESVIDHTLFGGIRDAGFMGGLEIYDWTGLRKGLAALVNRERNEEEAQKVADKIVAQRKRDPAGQIVLTGHSGGTGIAVFALEKLPKDVTVDGVLLLSPAISKDYDLSNALRHVNGRMYVFSSDADLFVLGIGTKIFGTIDRKNGDSAGRSGFVIPDCADKKQYEKLVSRPYEKAWVQFDNIGDHIGVMSRKFSRHVLTPIILEHLNKPDQPGKPSTQPAATRPASP